MNWQEFIGAFALFFFTHTVLLRPAIKCRIITRIGPRGFTTFYSGISLILLGWIIKAANDAPYVGLWDTAPWHYYFTQICMALAVIISALAIGRPNPLSFGGSNNHAFDPMEPGIIGIIRHPILASLFIWSFSHLIPNGDLAHLILFGAFSGFALLGMKIINRRNRRVLGSQEWERLTRKPQKRSIQIASLNFLSRVLLAILIYAILFYSHERIIGVAANL
ncbi:MAG: NnrU family protein [Rhizobiaceae bacterium]